MLDGATQILDAETQIIDDSTQILAAETQIVDDSTQILDAETQIIDDSTQILDGSTQKLDESSGRTAPDADGRNTSDTGRKPMLKRKSTEKVEDDSQSKLIKIESYFQKRELNSNKSMPNTENDPTALETKRQVSDETELKKKSSRKKITRNLLRTKFA